MQNSGLKRWGKEPDLWESLSLWTRYSALSGSQAIAKRCFAWILLAGYAGFVFGLPPLIWFTWHEWDFCRSAHVFSLLLPVYWIYLAVKAKQRHDNGEPFLHAPEEEELSRFEDWRAWRGRLYERSAAEKIRDAAVRMLILGVVILIFRARIKNNGYFWFLCAELTFRTILMMKRPPGFFDSRAMEPEVIS